ncbi:MAG: hypothetical protein K9W44_10295 [Candidatus Lokiarchaeota archaeon]|nr:hypothetical protein [Candidatus Harpocratesius repetitus]
MSDNNYNITDNSIQADNFVISNPDLNTIEKAEKIIEFRLEKLNVIHKILYFTVITVGLLLLYFRPIGIWAILLSPIIFFLIPILWKKIGMIFFKRDLVPLVKNYKYNIEKKNKKNKQQPKEKLKISVFWKVLNFLMDLKYDPTKTYYIERVPTNLNANKMKDIGNRIFDVISASLAITSLVGMIFTWISPISTVEEGQNLLKIIIIIVFISPLLSSWLIPTLWIMQDACIKSIDPDHNSENVGLLIRKGTLRKFLGTGGIMFGYGFLLQNIQTLQENIHSLGPAEVYLLAGAYLFGFIVIIAFPSIVLTFIYLFKFHVGNVNEIRKNLSDLLKTGTTTVEYI